MENWVIICQDGQDKLPIQSIQDFFTTLMTVATSLGIVSVMNRPPIFYSSNKSEQALISRITEAVNSAKQKKLQLILVILSKKENRTYPLVKQHSDVLLGIPSQCMLSSQVLKVIFIFFK